MDDYLEKACEEIDAGVFSSDLLHRTAQREMLEYYIGRWTRAIAAHDEIPPEED